MTDPYEELFGNLPPSALPLVHRFIVRKSRKEIPELSKSARPGGFGPRHGCSNLPAAGEQKIGGSQWWPDVFEDTDRHD